MNRKIGLLARLLLAFSLIMLSVPGGVHAQSPGAPTNPDPSDGATISETTSTNLSVDVSDPDGDSMDVSFYDASDDVVGVEWNVTDDSWNRIDANGDKITYSQDKFDNIYPWSHITRVNIDNTGSIPARYGDPEYQSNPANENVWVMTEIPRFYIKVENYTVNGDKVIRRWISGENLSGFEVHPMFNQRTSSKPAWRVYIGSYEAGFSYQNGEHEMTSQPGEQPWTGREIWEMSFNNGQNEPNMGDELSTVSGSDNDWMVEDYELSSGSWSGNDASGTLWVRKPGDDSCDWSSGETLNNDTQGNTFADLSSGPSNLHLDIEEARDYANNVGQNFGLMNVWSLWGYQSLLNVELGNMDSQSELGRGIVDKASGTGFNGELTGADSINSQLGEDLTGSGTGTDGYTPIAWRGIENPYGNVWTFVDGYEAVDDEYRILDPYGNWSNVGPSAWTSSDYQTSEISPLTDDDGYISDVEKEELLKYGFIPSETNGGSSEYIPDSFYSHDSGENNILRAGGFWDYGSATGAGCLGSSLGVGNSGRSVGARLEFIPEDGGDPIGGHLIGTDTGVSDGGTASVDWSSLTAGNDYSWYAVADDGSATTQSSTWSFHINESPTADFSYSPTDPLTNEQVSFTDESSDPDGTVDNWLWDFGDGNYDWVQNPDHTYTSSGTYTVELKAVENLMDSFEDGDLSPWSTGGDWAVQSNTVYEGNYSLELSGTYDSGTTQERDVSDDSYSYVSYTFRFDSTSSGDRLCFFSLKDSTDTAFVSIGVKDGDLVYESSLMTYTSITSVTTGTWYTVELKNIDYSRNTYDIWVNGVEENTDLSFQNDRNNIQVLEVWADTTTVDQYWDSIQLGESSTTTQDVTVSPSNTAPDALGTTTLSSTDPETAYDFKAGVGDSDGLSDVDEVYLRLYDSSLSYDSPDAERDHYSFKWTRGDGFTEVAPDSGDSHLNVSSCSAGDDALSEDNWTFNITLNAIANPNNDWNVWTKVVDNADASDSQEFANEFAVNTYISYSWGDGPISFSGGPGDTNIASSVNPVNSSVSTNVNFDVTHSVDGAMENDQTSDSIPTSNMYVENANGDRLTLSTSSQKLYSGVGYGDGVTVESNFFLDIPSGTDSYVYSNTYFLEVVQS